MKKVTVGILVAMVSLTTLAARKVIDLSGNRWTFDGCPVSVPHCWNAIDGSDNNDRKLRNDTSGWSLPCRSYDRKMGTYETRLPKAVKGRRYFLKFHGASVRAKVKINGKEVGSHVGGFTAFTFEVTDFLKTDGSSKLEVTVDNLVNLDTCPITGDFNLNGGLYRKVELIDTDNICIDPLREVKIDADANTGKVKAWVPVSNGEDRTMEFEIKDFELWTPETPNLYKIELKVGDDTITRRIGFRTVEFREDGGFYLNGKKRKMKGVCKHQDFEGVAWAMSAEQDELDIRLIKSMGCDAVRLAHYPHSQRVLDLCDEYGLLVWSEVPAVYLLSDTKAAHENMLQQAREMVTQHYNHPCVFGWSIFNEIAPREWKLREPGSMEAELRESRDLIHSLDKTRPVVAATCFPDDKELNEIPDALAYNIYPMWYTIEPLKDLIDKLLSKNGRKMTALSEYGGGGSTHHHRNPVHFTEPVYYAFHPEEWQVKVHASDLREITRRDDMWGSFVWAMFDFASDSRYEGDRCGINDKGLVTRDRVTMKDAYWLYRTNWNPERRLWLVGKRMQRVDSNRVEVIAFSNVGKVTLKVNGKEVSSKMPDEIKTVMWTDVPLEYGTNRIEVEADGLTDAVNWECSVAAHDYATDCWFVEKYRKAAIEIAHKKIKEITDAGFSARLATGGSFNGYFLWDTAFSVMWARFCPEEKFPIVESLDNFYRFAEKEPDGFIARQYDANGNPCWNSKYPIAFAPPLLAWAEVELDKSPCVVTGRLEKVYPALVRHHRAVQKRFRRDDGLYFSDGLGCGMDELPRWPRGMSAEERQKGGIVMDRNVCMPGSESKWAWLEPIAANYGWNRQAGWIDMSSQMALDALSLYQIAKKIGKLDEAKAWKAEYDRLCATINLLCWDEETGFYYDVWEKGLIKRRHAGAFWAITAGVARGERLKRMVAAIMDEKTFNRPVPVPCLPADDPDYNPEKGYWCGGVWPPTNYALIDGLVQYGYRWEAVQLARKWYNACAEIWVRTGTVMENLSPEQADHRRARSCVDFCGWGALAPVALPGYFRWKTGADIQE